MIYTEIAKFSSTITNSSTRITNSLLLNKRYTEVKREQTKFYPLIMPSFKRFHYSFSLFG